MATDKNYYGLLSPLDHRYVEPKFDPRIAVDKIDFARYIARLVKARPELMDAFFFDDARLTKH
jgi:hypothetical protein